MAIRRNAFTIAAGDSREFTDPADWVFFEAVGAGDASGVLEVVFNSNQGADQSGVLHPQTNYLFKSDKPIGFKRVTLQNRAGVDIDVIFMTGNGEFNPGASGANVVATIVGTPDVNLVGIGTTLRFRTVAPGHTAVPAPAADGALIAPLLDSQGRAIVAESLPQDLVDGLSAAITDTAAHDVIPAQGVGIVTTLREVTIANADAALPALVTILDDATPRLVVNLLAGASITISTRRRGTANKAWRASVAVASTVIVSASGFKGA